MPSEAARHAIELLVDEAGLDVPTSQWPLPATAISRALDALPSELPSALDAARDRVRRELRAQAGSRLSLTVRGRADALVGFGDDATPGSSIAVRSSTLSGPYVALQLGARIETLANADRSGSQFRLDDTAVATEALGVQLQAWSHRSWWSPGWQNALALGNNAPALSGIGIQRASASTSPSPWLSWLGPWNFEFFVAQTEDVSEPAHPYLVATHLTLRPFSHVELGLTKMSQWGGRGRPQSIRSFVDLLTGLHANADSVDQQPRDPGNGLAGFELRVRCPGGLRCAAYGEVIGEDEANHLPSRYLGTYGMEIWPDDGSGRFFAEYAETGCRTPIGRSPLKGCAYRNFAYPQGYTSAGRWIGAGVGPDSRLLTLGWIDATRDLSLRLHVGRVNSRVGTYSPLVDDPQFSGRLVGVSARGTIPWGAASVTPQIDWLRIASPSGPRTEARVGVRLDMSLDDAFDATRARLGASLSGAGASLLTPVLTAAGLMAGAALLDRPLDDYARKHGNNPSAKALRRVGDALPYAGVGLAGLAWLAQRGSTEGDVGFAAVSASVAAVAAARVIKLGVDRSRPDAGLGAADFGHTSRGQSSFPSNHAALAWAAVTPFAQYYDAPWLYGAAALTSASRTLGRQHWFSDTVGGALLGYWMGDFFSRRQVGDQRSAGWQWWVGPRSVVVQASFD